MISEPQSEILNELVFIRKLMMFSLVRDGVSQTDLASALGLSQSSISRMVASAKPSPSTPKRRSKS